VTVLGAAFWYPWYLLQVLRIFPYTPLKFRTRTCIPWTIHTATGASTPLPFLFFRVRLVLAVRPLTSGFNRSEEFFPATTKRATSGAADLRRTFLLQPADVRPTRRVPGLNVLLHARGEAGLLF
jgi:hypothetical protein